MTLDRYTTLGRSGLVVSPLALGTMTFGTDRWGTDTEASRDVFNAYVDRGGNFIDTADVYSGGRSEEMVGMFVRDRSLRASTVIATKSGYASGAHVSSGGNGTVHIHAALDASLKRLNTDFIDLYWVHVWDGATPAEELLDTISSLIRSGKIRYWGISSAPAWYIAQICMLARQHGCPAPIGLQFFYSLVNREIEIEHIPMADTFGLGMIPWSPLAYGLLAGKYDRGTVGDDGKRSNERLAGENPFGTRLFTERNWNIVDVLKRVADEAGAPPARVALAWTATRPHVVSTLLGVSSVAQLEDNVQALELDLSPEHLRDLNAATEPESFLGGMFTKAFRTSAVFGGNSVVRYPH